AALAAGAAGHAAEQVAEQRFERHALRQRVAETAVRVEEIVVPAQRRHGAGLQSLLPEARMPEAAEAVLGDVPLELELGGAYQRDRAIEAGGELGVRQLTARTVSLTGCAPRSSPEHPAASASGSRGCSPTRATRSRSPRGGPRSSRRRPRSCA